MTAPLILHYAPDNASLCVRLALLELGMSFTTTLVDRAVQGQKAPTYLALNPNGLIPTLVTPHGPIYETAAILLWLADLNPGAAFPAVDDPARGAALTRLFWLSNTVHPLLRMVFYPDQYVDSGQHALRAKSRAKLNDLFAQLDTAQQCDWLNAQSPSILGCYLAPMLRWSALYGGDTAMFDLHNFPRLKNFAKVFGTRSAMTTAAQAEGLGPTPISAPSLPHPPEGTAL